ncbi:MAG: hypothetical protein GW903_09510 [Alphaproteobacteria bacterium]|nr:hypothetical protein [Alphaproteobacteria bacterium]NCQ89218.1 hypothetical protein [Alphaproteobacteria bacterium]NCT08106.1 hypothetical protein [Alphaproteobacteria bacterium]
MFIKAKQTTLLTLALLTAGSGMALASEANAPTPKMTKEVTELVGYNVTESVTYQGLKEHSFNKIDANSDGMLTAKEMQRGTNLENSYDIFLNMDSNKDMMVSIEEFSSYNKTKGNTQMRSTLEKENGEFRSVKGTNIKSKPVVTKEYFEAVKPKIVKEEAIN